MLELIRRLFRRDAGNDVENAFGDPDALRILQRADLPALKSLFAGIPRNWPRRYFYSLAMSRSFPERKLQKWTKQAPDSADAWLVYGARLLKLAWELRGYGLAKGVSEQSRERFFDKLNDTEQALLRAAELSPDDPTPWAYLIMVAVYRSDGAAAEEHYFSEAVARDPENWHAHMSRLTGLGEKYGGSHSAMFEFARSVRSALPDGSLLHGLVLKAHSEYWKYLHHYEDNADAAEAHRTDPETIAECLDAYARALGGGMARHPDRLFCAINAAGTLWILRQKGPLREVLHGLEGRISDIHWRWVGTEGELARARQFARG